MNYKIIFYSLSVLLVLPFYAAEDRASGKCRRETEKREPLNYKKSKKRRYYDTDESAFISAFDGSPHDTRLTEEARKYFGAFGNGGFHCYPLKTHLAQSFQETLKVPIPWRSYRNLKNKFMPFETKDTRPLFEYMREQYALNRCQAIECRYTALMVFEKFKIELPLELRQKIVLSIDPMVFKADFIVMFGITCTAQEPLPHLKHIYDTYEQLTETDSAARMKTIPD